MNPRTRVGFPLLALLLLGVVLVLIFPAAAKFAEATARELRYLWWLILLVALASWLFWGAARRPK